MSDDNILTLTMVATALGLVAAAIAIWIEVLA